jgi:hypothetical protein
MTLKTTLIALSLGLAAAGGLSATASAETRWENHHPRQDQVLDRVHRQRQEIRVERREGEISRAKAHRLMTAENRLAREDRRDARINGGYITKGQQRHMDRQENRLHRHVEG